MTEDEPDYITISPAVTPYRYCVMLMHSERGEYVIRKISRALPHGAAENLARSWATALGIGVR